MARWASPSFSVFVLMVAAVMLLLVACGGEATTASAPPSRVNEPGGYAKSLVDQAVQRYTDDGRDAAIAYYNTSESVDGDWYVFIMEENGTIVAHGARPELVGEDFTGPLGTDVTGNEFGSDLAAATEQGRWVEYVFLNPGTGKEERKHTWALKHDGLIFGSGWYERDVDIRAEPPAFTLAFVERALWRYATQGRDATVAYYNTPESVDGDWYVFIIDENNTVIAHGARPELVGEDITGPLGTDATGNEFGSDLVAATEQGHWVDYVFLIPGTDREGQKHTWAVKRDGLVFASGWYER